MQNRFFRIAGYTLGILAILAIVGYFAFQKLTSPPAPVNPVLAGNSPSVTLMDFASPPTVEPITPGWW